MNLPDRDPLYVVTSVFNPLRYQSRIRLYRDFEKYVRDSGAILYTAEVAFGGREFTVTEAGDSTDIQLRTRHELWLKENALNLAVQRLPSDWKYVAWVDADVIFARPDWVNETRQQLQHTPVLQLFSRALDMGPNHEAFQEARGFAYCYRNGIPRGKTLTDRTYYGYEYWHPGYAWAMTRQAWDDLGGLIDFAILGAADWHMACSLVGHAEWSLPEGINPGYAESVGIWQARAERYIQGHIGYVEGTLLHSWHGKKRDRKYRERWQVLLEEEFDPEFDLKRDFQGLWQLTDRSPRLRRACHDYFSVRNEDSIDM